MSRKQIEYEIITCDHCGNTWTTEKEYQVTTVAVTKITVAKIGGGKGTISYDLCKDCSKLHEEWISCSRFKNRARIDGKPD